LLSEAIAPYLNWSVVVLGAVLCSGTETGLSSVLKSLEKSSSVPKRPGMLFYNWRIRGLGCFHQFLELLLVQSDTWRRIQPLMDSPISEEEHGGVVFYFVFFAEVGFVVYDYANAFLRIRLDVFLKDGQEPLAEGTPRSVEKNVSFLLLFNFLIKVSVSFGCFGLAFRNAHRTHYNGYGIGGLNCLSVLEKERLRATKMRRFFRAKLFQTRISAYESFNIWNSS
jgi:hypothetical protein